MQINDLDQWRYPGDVEALRALLAEEPVRRGMENDEVVRARDSTRAKLLAGAVMVEPNVLPHLSAAVKRMTGMCPDVGDVECFVFNTPEVNAFITTGRSRTLVAVSSAAVNHLDAEELEFILGHELGHAFLKHTDLAVNQLVESGTLAPTLSMRMRAWQRAAEISADRAGLLLCGSPEAAARALFKAASGIVAPGATSSPQHLAGQWQRLVNEVVEEGSRDFWQITHPFPPLRMKAMLLFWESCRSPGNGAALAEANDAVARMLDMMDPAAAERTLNDPMLSAFFFWGGLYVALADGDMPAEEMRRLAAVAPLGVTVSEAVAGARANADGPVERFGESVRGRRRKLSAVELHRIIYGLIDVASADGRISDEESARLCRLAGVLGIPATACDLIITQYQQEAASAD